MKSNTRGAVFLVGAGPGDPGLITVRAIECLRQADVVYYDFLVNPELLAYAPAGSRKVYSGKQGGKLSVGHSVEQKKIIAKIVREALRGRTIVRLKGGDPFLFGRGGEEGEALARRGIPFEVVPGVSSALAVPAYAGIPMTHRDYASSVAFITGHEKREQDGASRGLIPPFDWQTLAQIDTLCILMGVRNLADIVASLLQVGKSPETPVAVIESGTLPIQRTIEGGLNDIVKKVEAAQVKPPAIMVVGPVVRLRPLLRWFEKRPLFGKRILVTRTQEQAGELSRLLRAAGAEVLEVPTIELHPPRSYQALDRALRHLDDYQWVLFTSQNAVQSFCQRLSQQGKDLRCLAGVKVAAIGAATAALLLDKGIKVDVVPAEFNAEGLSKIFQRRSIQGQRILIPRARKGREGLLHALRQAGAKVDLVEAYQTLMPRQGRKDLRRLLLERPVDWVTFTSSATVENFYRMLGAKPLLRGVRIACIGPVTAQTVRKLGWKVSIMPKQATIPHLVRAIIKTK